jgi:hypothetical protein
MAKEKKKKTTWQLFSLKSTPLPTHPVSCTHRFSLFLCTVQVRAGRCRLAGHGGPDWWVSTSAAA